MFANLSTDPSEVGARIGVAFGVGGMSNCLTTGHFSYFFEGSEVL